LLKKKGGSNTKQGAGGWWESAVWCAKVGVVVVGWGFVVGCLDYCSVCSTSCSSAQLCPAPRRHGQCLEVF